MAPRALVTVLLVIALTSCSRSRAGSVDEPAVGAKSAGTAKQTASGSSPKGQDRRGPLTADQVEGHLEAMGFKLPSSAVHLTIISVTNRMGNGVVLGAVSVGPPPRPFGAPRKGTAFTRTCMDYDHRSTEAQVKGFVEAGRFLYFAGTERHNTQAMIELLRRIDPSLVQKHAELTKTAARRKSKNRATIGDVILCVTPQGTILMSSKKPTVARTYGLN